MPRRSRPRFYFALLANPNPIKYPIKMENASQVCCQRQAREAHYLLFDNYQSSKLLCKGTTFLQQDLIKGCFGFFKRPFTKINRRFGRTKRPFAQSKILLQMHRVFDYVLSYQQKKLPLQSKRPLQTHRVFDYGGNKT